MKTLLIANRGEIACRIMRTARAMGIRTVAVYSETDANAQHVVQADVAIALSGETAAETYLDIEQIVSAAIIAGADAIHPGYGFLSENAAFAAACEEANVTFVGPPASAIEAMGSKAVAKDLMRSADVPLLPGEYGTAADIDRLREVASSMGYPVLLKAAAGGGGKGMREVRGDGEFEEAFASAQREARASFGDDLMLVEKLLERPRHVEVQVFFDQQGQGVALFDRDCSVQRRYQKVVEEAPAPDLPESTRSAMRDAAIAAAQAIDYVGAGTVEFLVGEDHAFYFMEMNTRLQVEHLVTEWVAGVDLVGWQLAIASGEPLPLSQEALNCTGHAIEVRLYAEDPDNDYLPSTGRIERLRFPAETSWVRIDSGVIEGDEVSVHFDPMIAKIIARGSNREAACHTMLDALREVQVAGVATNLELLERIVGSSNFQRGPLQTGLLAELPRADVDSVEAFSLAMIWLWESLGRRPDFAGSIPSSPWDVRDGFRVNAGSEVLQDVVWGGKRCSIRGEMLPARQSGLVCVDVLGFTMTVEALGNALLCDGATGRWRIEASQRDHTVWLFATPLASTSQTLRLEYTRQHPGASRGQQTQARSDQTAPMTGRVVKVNVVPGDSVEAGDVLVVLEAMKMEHSVRAAWAGQVSEVNCKQGELVEGGTRLVEVEPHAED